MASAFGHAAVALAFGTGFKKHLRTFKFFFLGVLCAILPDADVITFRFGIEYESFWGHRGFSHSLVFALFIALLCTYLFYKKSFFTRKGFYLILFFFICTASHGVLDALTTGGRGVAFFSPFDNGRYFLPWRVIKVSPMSASRFFTEYGWKVIKNEAIWIGIPSLIYVLSIKAFRNK